MGTKGRKDLYMLRVEDFEVTTASTVNFIILFEKWAQDYNCIYLIHFYSSLLACSQVRETDNGTCHVICTKPSAGGTENLRSMHSLSDEGEK